MQKKRLFLQVFRTFAVVFLSLLAFGQQGYAQQLNQNAQNSLLRGQMQSFKLLPAPKPMPDVVFKNVAGQPVSLSSFRGKLVLLTMWATWCPYCGRELPTLEMAQDALGKDKFMVLPISVDKEGPSIVKKYLEEKSLNLPTYSDQKNLLSRALGAQGVPYCILIDQEGREIGRISGETNWAAPESIELLRAFMR